MTLRDDFVKANCEEVSSAGKGYFGNYLLTEGFLILETFRELTTAGVNVLQGKESASVQTFKNNITDLYTVDKNGWKSTNTQNDIKDKSDVEVLDISEKVDTEGGWFSSSPLSQEGIKLLTKRLTNYAQHQNAQQSVRMTGCRITTVF